MVAIKKGQFWLKSASMTSLYAINTIKKTTADYSLLQFFKDAKNSRMQPKPYLTRY